MMRYESQKTPRGNVGVSYESQEAADAQAAEMDRNNCSDCSDCSRCSRCSDCSGCSRCSRCSDCSGCSDCSRCYDCSGCYDCSDCSRCYDCSDCSGALWWSAGEAKNLLAVNGLRWPVATDGVRIQIGCQNHTAEQWGSFDDAQISRMDTDALEFWMKHKSMIMVLAVVRAEEKQ